MTQPLRAGGHPDTQLLERVRAAVADAYQVERQIGRGGMAVVYEATDRRLRRRVALKVLPPELAFREDIKSRFIREAQTAAQLNHPNIVPIYAVDERDGIVFFAMGLVDGATLAELIVREPQLPLETVRTVLSQVADALGYAHAHGVVHRDVKPDNILMDRMTGRAMVTDFGIARAAEGDQRLTVTGVAVGTPTYMSPEQATGDRDLDGRSDIYSLGVVGYQLLAGAPPFSAANTPAMLMKHVTETPTPLVGVRPDAPRDLLQVIDVALRKDSRQRWATGALLRDALAGGDVARAAFATVAIDEPRRMGTSVGELARGVGQIAAVSARAAIEAVQAEQQKAKARAIGVDVPPLPEPYTSPPRYPAWRDGMTKQDYRLMVEQWKSEAEAWRERQEMLRQGIREQARRASQQRREYRDEWKEALRDGLVIDVQTGQAGASPVLPLEVRVRSFRRKLYSNGALVAGLAVINAATVPFPWVIFPTFGIGMDLLNRYWRLRDAGVTWRDAVRGVVTPGAVDPLASMPAAQVPPGLSAGSPAPAAVTANAVDREIAAFAPGVAESRDPFLREGKTYATVRTAASDRIAIRDTLAKLSEADRGMIPDAMPTVNGLCERVATLAQHVARIDHDLSGNVRYDVEERLQALAREPQSPDRERRQALLERQRSSLDDLAARRETFARQLDSASIALRNLRLDLAKLRSSGVGSVINDVSSATQEARALSVDIARALEVADEVRKI
jgi:hypothetical protein